VLAPVAALWLIAQRRVPLSERLRRAAITTAPILAAVWVFVTVQRIETGHWDAFFLIQEKYESWHGSENPFLATRDIVRAGLEDLPSGIAAVIGLQTALITIVLALVLVFAFLRREWFDRADSLVLLFAVATWVMLFQTASVQRGQAALLPLAVLVARLPSRLAWSLVVVAAAIDFWLETYFLGGTLL
jgi:hypothetical protein